MQKIAVTTMTGSANYGNALQNYAVLKLIEQNGYMAETLRITTQNGYPDAIPDQTGLLQKLCPDYIKSWRQSKLSSQCGAKNDADLGPHAVKELKEKRAEWQQAVKRKQARFDDFQKKILHYTDFEVSNLDFNLDNLKQYAAFVTGSDQVWNPYYRTNSMVEFLQIVPKEKRIAFVPSFGVSDIPECRKKEYTQWLSEIPYLSVRESEGARIIHDLTGKEAKVLLDPTFGLTKEEWLDFAQKPDRFDLKPDTYVFCYFLGNRTKAYTKFIHQYVKKHRCQIIDVYDVARLAHYTTSPPEFVWILAHAKAVFTDSFHGCAFSVNLQKPFVVFDRAGDGCIAQSSRITTVLGKTGLVNRKFEQLGIEAIDEIDFDHAKEVVSAERNEMLSYLKASLDSAVSSDCSIHLTTKRHCTGCGACVNACSQNAITMEADEEGFLYPGIHKGKCVGCHACENVCPSDRIKPEKEETKAFYAFSNQKEICENSSSGGLFTALAEIVLEKNGIVFGAGYNQNFKVCHMAAEHLDQLVNLRTSKYVQSDILDVYQNVQTQLQTGRQVLFSGTPCQIAGLKSFLKRDDENLLLVDIICHGVPSPKIWEDYLHQKHGHKKIKAVNFRNKDLGWNDFSMKVDYEDGTAYRELAVEDPFERAFLANLTLRPSCYQCQYKTVERVSDLTIADYWGVETVHAELKEQQGVSLVLIHSERGMKAFESLKNVTSGETDLKRATGMNSGCTRSVPWPAKRNEFFDLESRIGVSNAAEECLKLNHQQKVQKFIVRNGSRGKKVLRRVGILK